MRLRLPVVAAALGASLIAGAPAGAAPGDLDPSFGDDGVAVADFGPGIPLPPEFDDRLPEVDLARQADGKLVVAGAAPGGGFAVARFNPDGTLDPTFGSAGLATVPVGGAAEAKALAIQATGRIVVAGVANVGSGNRSRMALARFLQNGSLDTTFGSGGTAFAPADPESADTGAAYALGLRSDGRLIAAGSADVAPNCGGCWGLARFSQNGVLESFVASPVGSESRAHAALVIPDGRIYSAGEDAGAFTLARHNASHALDPQFAGKGYVQPRIGRVGKGAPPSSAAGLVLHADSRVTLGGRAPLRRVCDSCFAATRHLGSGSLDRSFSRDGRSVVAMGPLGRAAPAAALDVAEQADGKVVLAGHSDARRGGTGRFALLRYGPEGVDAGFGRNGVATAAVGSDSTGPVGAYAVVLQPDGRIVTAGLAEQAGHPVLALARFEGGDAPDDTRPRARVKPVRQRLRRVARRGYKCGFAVDEAAGVVCDVRLGRKRIGSKGTRTDERRDRGRVRVRLRSSAQRRIRRLRRARLTIRLTVVDDANNVRRVRRRVTLRR